MSTNKPKVIKDFEKLTEEMQNAVNEFYPDGFYDHLVKFADRDGKYVHALPFETEDRYYLLKLPKLINPKVVKEPDSDKEGGPEGGDEQDEQSSGKFADLDTMQIGGRKKDEDDDYD
jgi:hypothetical protein